MALRIGNHSLNVINPFRNQWDLLEEASFRDVDAPVIHSIHKEREEVASRSHSWKKNS
jgi:hypothetical protein